MMMAKKSPTYDVLLMYHVKLAFREEKKVNS